MPKVVNYAARFEFLRRAAFLVVRDQGPQALSRRSVASTLGTSVNSVRRLVSEEADLRQLAADEVAQRRSRGRWDQRRDLTGVDRATFLLGRVLPDEEHRVGEELVWLRLVLDSRALAAGGDTVAALQAEHLVADRGYVPESHRPPDPGSAPADVLADLWCEHDELVDRAVAEALAAVGADSVAERARTRAVVDGLLLSTCLGRTAPAGALTTLEHHLGALGAAARVTA